MTAYKDIPELSLSTLRYVSQKFGIADVSDFDPKGDRSGSSIPWNIVSQAVLVRDNYACRICGANYLGPVDSSRNYDKLHFSVEVHHIIPRKDGGKDTFKNLITLCESCHHKTFSNNYSGIPGENSTNLDMFYGKIWLIIPSQIESNVEKFELGAIQDYGIVLDPNDGIRRIARIMGEKIKVSVVKISINGFLEIAELARKTLSAIDYFSLFVKLEDGREIVARCLKTDDYILV